MYDFLEITVPFKSDFINQSNGCGYVDFAKLSSSTGLKVAAGDCEYSVSGESVIRDLYVPWSKLPSSYTDIACKVFDAAPEANIEWGYFRFKASPAKVMQGHNVYGSDNLRNCLEHLLYNLQTASPELYNALEWGLAEFSRIDSTYSIKFESKDIMAQAVRALRCVHNRYVRPSNRYINKSLGDDLSATVYWNAATSDNADAGRSKTLLFYVKDAELKNQLSTLQRRAKKERSDRYDHVLSELCSHKLQEFTANRGRFEGRAKKRLLNRVCGTSNIWAVLRYAEKFESTNGYSFCEYLFNEMFGDLFDALEGGEIEVYDDYKVKNLLRTTYFKMTPKGNISYAKADRLFRFYLSLCDRGYDYIKAHTHKSTLKRNIDDLCAIGLSKADLQTAKNGERMKLGKVISIDFNNQRPDDYVEPESPYTSRLNDNNYLVNEFGYSPRLAHEFGLAENKVDALIDALGLSEDEHIDDLLDFQEIPISPRESLSLVVWPDGEIALTRHKQTKFKPNPIISVINPDFEQGYQTHIN